MLWVAAKPKIRGLVRQAKGFVGGKQGMATLAWIQKVSAYKEEEATAVATSANFSQFGYLGSG